MASPILSILSLPDELIQMVVASMHDSRYVQSLHNNKKDRLYRLRDLLRLSATSKRFLGVARRQIYDESLLQLHYYLHGQSDEKPVSFIGGLNDFPTLRGLISHIEVDCALCGWRGRWHPDTHMRISRAASSVVSELETLIPLLPDLKSFAFWVGPSPATIPMLDTVLGHCPKLKYLRFADGGLADLNLYRRILLHPSLTTLDIPLSWDSPMSAKNAVMPLNGRIHTLRITGIYHPEAADIPFVAFMKSLESLRNFEYAYVRDFEYIFWSDEPSSDGYSAAFSHLTDTLQSLVIRSRTPTMIPINFLQSLYSVHSLRDIDVEAISLDPEMTFDFPCVVKFTVNKVHTPRDVAVLDALSHALENGASPRLRCVRVYRYPVDAIPTDLGVRLRVVCEGRKVKLAIKYAAWDEYDE